MPRCLRADARRDALLPRLTTDEARCILKRKWLYIIGDSSTRFERQPLAFASSNSEQNMMQKARRIGCFENTKGISRIISQSHAQMLTH